MEYRETMEKDQVKPIKVVLIGGSAGGLEALLQILPGLRSIPYALVIVLHRQAGDDQLLEQLLTSKLSLPVDDTEDKVSLEPGRIYVAPADYHLLFEKDGRLSLDVSDKVNFSRPSIDVAFESAAEAYGSLVAGILLSGANADGTAGLNAIKSVGGLTVVQAPSEAVMPIMPEHAIANMNPDLVLKNSEIAEWLRNLR